MTPTNTPFIGRDALVELARTLAPTVAMRAFEDHKNVFDRMHIKVISGVEYQLVNYLWFVKGHTTRRKVIGMTFKKTAGYVKERTIKTYLVMDRFTSNQDAFRETPLRSPDGNLGYPRSIQVIETLCKQQADNVFDCLFWGDNELGLLDADGTENPNADMGLYDGFITAINNDILEGNVKPISLSGSFGYPVNVNDVAAFTTFRELYNKLDVHLQSVPTVWITTPAVVEAISMAYANAHGHHKEVNDLPNGNVSIPGYPLIELCGHPIVGQGDRVIVSVYDNLQYVIDTLGSSIDVQFGDDDDARNITIQPQSAQGAGVMNVTSSWFAVTDGDLSCQKLAGDYDKDLVFVSSNDTALGTVKVNGEDPEVGGTEYDRGTILTLTATASGTGEFVRWSDGSTDAEHVIITAGQPLGITAIFKAKG